MKIPLALLVMLVAPGCALLFTQGQTTLGVIPRDPGSNVVIRTVLPRDAHDIKFFCASPGSNLRDDDRVVVTLTNSSSKRYLELEVPDPFAIPGARSTRYLGLAPNHSIQLYAGTVTGLLAERPFSISTLGHRVACELHIEFSTTPKLDGPIAVTCFYSSPTF